MDEEKTECCEGVILDVIRMLGDIWREFIGYWLKEETEKWLDNIKNLSAKHGKEKVVVWCWDERDCGGR